MAYYKDISSMPVVLPQVTFLRSINQSCQMMRKSINSVWNFLCIYFMVYFQFRYWHLDVSRDKYKHIRHLGKLIGNRSVCCCLSACLFVVLNNFIQGSNSEQFKDDLISGDRKRKESIQDLYWEVVSVSWSQNICEADIGYLLLQKVLSKVRKYISSFNEF